jgi:hypothetical protein
MGLPGGDTGYVHVPDVVRTSREGRESDHINITNIIIAGSDAGYIYITDVICASREGREAQNVHVPDVVRASGKGSNRDGR